MTTVYVEEPAVWACWSSGSLTLKVQDGFSSADRTTGVQRTRPPRCCRGSRKPTRGCHESRFCHGKCSDQRLRAHAFWWLMLLRTTICRGLDGPTTGEQGTRTALTRIGVRRNDRVSQTEPPHVWWEILTGLMTPMPSWRQTGPKTRKETRLDGPLHQHREARSSRQPPLERRSVFAKQLRHTVW